jgi:hypothetical protein
MVGLVIKRLCLFQIYAIRQKGTVNREGALKVVLVMVGLLLLTGIYPLIRSLRQEPVWAMMLSLYVTLGFPCSWPRLTHRRIVV